MRPRPATCPLPVRASLLTGVAVWLVLFCWPVARAQQPEPPPLRVDGLTPTGARSSVTGSWGTLEFSVTNLTDTDRDARVLAFYEGQEDLHYGRDVWVPARSTLSTWMLIGPAPAKGPAAGPAMAREIQFRIHDRTGGQDRLLLPRGEKRTRSRAVRYERERCTALLLDVAPPEEEAFGHLPRPESLDTEALRLAHVFRHTRKFSEFVQLLTSATLPPTAETLDGVEHFLLASDRLEQNPDGLKALRRWLQRGGEVWVMLDRVGPETLALLLGDAFDFHVIDRVRLTSFQMERPQDRPDQRSPVKEFELPVTLARVLLPPGEQPPCSVGGWPAWFTRRVGRGRVVFTAIGPRAWYRPRVRTDPPSQYEHQPDLPVATEFFEDLALELKPRQGPAPPFQTVAFDPLLAEEVGYSIPGRVTVALIFGGFLLAALALAALLRRIRRPGLRSWLGPAAAVAAAMTFLALGESSRRAVPPTLAVGQIIDAGTGTDELAVDGRLALYRPDAGPLEAGTTQGGLFELDTAGLEGQMRRLVLTDLGAWHWEGLALPAGMRFGSFRHTARAGAPVTAVAHFGPEGLEGRFAAGSLRGLSDALLHVPGGRNLAVRLGPEEGIRIGSGDILPAGQFLASAVLSDRQQRRLQLVRQFLAPPQPERLRDRIVLLAWAEPVDTGFRLAPGARLTGDALLVVPLRLEPSPPGTRVTIPGPFVSSRRVQEQGSWAVTSESQEAVEMHLRFQVPAAVLPLDVERARLVVRISAPTRRVTVAGRTSEALVELRRVDNPADPIRVEIIDQRLLRLDGQGGLHLNLNISAPLRAQTDKAMDPRGEKWKLDYVELEVSGRTR